MKADGAWHVDRFLGDRGFMMSMLLWMQHEANIFPDSRSPGGINPSACDTLQTILLCHQGILIISNLLGIMKKMSIDNSDFADAL